MSNRKTSAEGVGPFGPDEFLPATGNPFEARNGSVAQELAVKLAIFDTIYIANPAHNEVFAALDELRNLGLNANGGRMFGVRNAAPSGSGKTTAARVYQERLNSALPKDDERRLVTVVSLDKACTTRRLWASILEESGDEFFDRGTEDVLKRRAWIYLRRIGTQLLIIDEIQHLAFRSTERNDVTDAIKSVLDQGVVPLALFGTDDAKPMLERNVQLTNRMLPPCDLRPLDLMKTQDRADFVRFVKNLDLAMVQHGLTRTASGLDEARIIACLFEVSSGIVGRVVNLLRNAYAIAFRREADRVELCDLSNATERWAVAQGMIGRDPFRHGVMGSAK